MTSFFDHTFYILGSYGGTGLLWTAFLINALLQRAAARRLIISDDPSEKTAS